MAWIVPRYSKAEVNAAGATLVNDRATGEELDHALTIINNWRSSHSFPLNTFQVTLRSKASYVDNRALRAQRIKRLSSIALKLLRFPTMKLGQMQDIGGCRAIVSTTTHVRGLRDLYVRSDLKHEMLRQDDYIESPKDSGYRGIHLIYRYHSDRTPTFNGLQIELQLRSRLQHAWATAVETVGTFLKQSLKSSQGSEPWLRFFSLMGSALAMRERAPLIPKTPMTKVELVAELRQKVKELDVFKRLQAYGAALKRLENPGTKGAHYYLLALKPFDGTVTISGFKSGELERATAEYLKIETA